MPKGNSGGKREPTGLKGWAKRTGVKFAPELDTVLSDEQKIELMKQVKSATDIFGYDNAKDEIVKEIIGGESGIAYASYTHNSGKVRVNTYYYDGNYDRIRKSYERDVATGFHPKGTDWRSIISHETGHAIEDKIADAFMRKPEVRNMSFDKAFKYKFMRQGTHDIVNKAVANVKKSGVYGKNVSAYSIKDRLSGYSHKNQSETFAEAIADYSQNGKNSNPLSLEIVKLTKEVLGR